MKLLTMKILLIFSFLIIFIRFDQEDITDRYIPQTYISSTSDSLLYRLLKPKNYDENQAYPLVILLHGSGERGNDNEAQLTHGAEVYATDEAMEKYPCFVMVPQCPAKKGWANMKFDKEAEEFQLRSGMRPEMQLVIETLDQLRKTYNIDENRLYITGLSMGGFGTFDICMRKPDLFAAAAPVCGGGDTTQAALIKDIPMWVFHGADDNTVSVNLSRSMVQAIKEAGGNPKYTEYPGVGHNSWNNAYSEPDFLPWLFAQKKN